MKFPVYVAASILVLIPRLVYAQTHEELAPERAWLKAIIAYKKKIDCKKHPWGARFPGTLIPPEVLFAKSETAPPVVTEPKPRSKDYHIEISSDSNDYRLVDGCVFVPLTPEEEAAANAAPRPVPRQDFAWLMDADRFAAKGDFAKARPLYERRLREEPGDMATLEDLADICFEEGRYREMRDLTIAGLNSSSPITIWLQASLALALCGQVLEGQRQYSTFPVGQSLELPPGSRPIDVQLNSALGIIDLLEHASDDNRGLTRYIQFVLRLAPKNATVQYCVAESDLNHKKYSEAAEHFVLASKYATGSLRAAADKQGSIARQKATLN